MAMKSIVVVDFFSFVPLIVTKGNNLNFIQLLLLLLSRVRK